jgi:predicted Zn-dependent peptidase
MDNSLKRLKIADGVHFNSVTDPRFKFNCITFGIYTPLCEEKSSLNALIPRLISKTNAKYPEERDFSNYLASLYNAKSDNAVSAGGDTQFFAVSMTFMDDSYALHGEKITEAAAKIIFDCIFEPVVVNNAFDETKVELCKREQIEAIEAEINEKRNYAMNQARRVIYKGEPAAVNHMGDVIKTAEITPQVLYETYNELLKSAVIEIICIGCNDFSDALKITKEKFLSLNRKDIITCESLYSPLKPNAEEIIERMPLNQSKMVLGFKTDSKNHYAINLMNGLYGGTLSSKLFLNVRERLSLCYYCSSAPCRDKGVMYVQCGVEETNIDKAKAEILAQLDDIKNGNVTDEEMNNALLYSLDSHRTVNDSIRSLMWWYIIKIYQGDIKSPDEYMKGYENITREDVINAAKSMNLDTFYTLRGNGESEGDDE